MDRSSIIRELIEIIVEYSFKLGEFTLASGKKSDYYIDCRTTTLHPRGLYLIAKVFLDELKGEDIDSIGGLTLGADPIVGAMTALSAETEKPLRGFIVRKEQKDHGTGKLIEGNLFEKDRVAIIEDVITTGGSAQRAIDAVKALGAIPKIVLAVVDREEGGREKLLEQGLKVFSIFFASELKLSARKK